MDDDKYVEQTWARRAREIDADADRFQQMTPAEHIRDAARLMADLGIDDTRRLLGAIAHTTMAIAKAVTRNE